MTDKLSLTTLRLALAQINPIMGDIAVVSGAVVDCVAGVAAVGCAARAVEVTHRPITRRAVPMRPIISILHTLRVVRR